MKLVCHSNELYLSVSNAQSLAGGHYFLSSPPDYKTNGAIHTMSQIIQNVIEYATEAENAALYMNERELVAIRNILKTLGHEQQPTMFKSDSAMAEGILNKKMQPKWTKAMDMRFHWLRKRQQQKHVNIFWKPGILNLGDYHTKHHPASHHKK